MMKYFTEIGIGNETIVNTEIEHDNSTEERFQGMTLGSRFVGLYFRLWIGYHVYILSTNEGFKKQLKSRKEFKLLIGLQTHTL